jgi:tetratricopeptide (TPR) repeat protein
MLKRRAAFRFETRRCREALEDLAAAVEKNPGDTSNLTWISPAAVATCPDEEFRDGVLALADKTIERTNGSGAAYVARAALHWAMGNTSAAKKNLDAGISSATVDHYTRYRHALLCLATDDVAGYRADCAEMLRQFAHSQNAEELHFAAWTNVLAPNAVDDLHETIELSRRAVERSSSSQPSLQTFGAALLRAGNFVEAKDVLQQAESAAANDMTLPAYGWYFLAMTCFQLGDRAEARRWFDQAAEHTEKSLREGKTAHGESVPWNRKLTLELLHEEAKTLIGPGDPDQPADAAAAIGSQF